MGDGWLLDVYEASAGIVVWWLEKRSGARIQYHHPFVATFYISGSHAHLRQAWRFLTHQRPERLLLSRETKRELFQGEIDLLAVGVQEPNALQRVAKAIKRRFPQLVLYDVDVPISLRFCAAYDLFSLCLAHVKTENGVIKSIHPKENRWQQRPSSPPLRTLKLWPSADPTQTPPTAVFVEDDRGQRRLPLTPPHLLLKQLNVIFKRYDPDIVLTQFGDSWLFPQLRQFSQQTNVPFNPSRDSERPFLLKAARTIHSYGHVEHRHGQTHLHGRFHIDRRNSMMFGDYKVAGILEQARVTAMPIQEVARKSPGAGITAMQMMTALQSNLLIPYDQQQIEYPKTAATLIKADRGGLVYQPLIGLHRNVIEIDFSSMYPSIMVAFNLSPETIRPRQAGEPSFLPDLDIVVDAFPEGLIPQTLRPLLTKRLSLKKRIAGLHYKDCRMPELKSRSNALKWLLVVSFGYQGFRHSKFGRIEAHEAITAYGREALLRAKEVAEEKGYQLLHMYVDGLWIRRPDGSVPTKKEIDQLLRAITRRTRLPIALEGIYEWLAFLPSKRNKAVPVPNRYFGAFDDGQTKVRGIALRRRDTPPFIKQLQQQMIAILAQGRGGETAVSRCLKLVKTELARLKAGKMPLETLVVTQRLSRDLTDYRQPSPAARAARQLQKLGKSVHAGERVKFVYTRDRDVQHWHQAQTPQAVDINRYAELMIRAAAELLTPFGHEKEQIIQLVHEQPRQPRLLMTEEARP